MKFFGKRQKSGAKPEKKQRKKKVKKNKPRKNKYKTPGDVKIFYVMPALLLIGLMLTTFAIVLMHKNTVAYKAQVMASSMSTGEKLPLWGGTSRGELLLGHTKLSKDGKTLAVEIKYDNKDTHKLLSSFGDRYGLRLVDTTDNKMNVQMTYGLFGTDGSGTLTIHSDKGFKNHAFIVMLIDKGHLVSTEDLQSDVPTSDTDLDKSITAQLSGSTADQQAQQSQRKKNLPPLYYVRLNAKTAPRSDRDWHNDRDIVEDLFVDSNIEKLTKQKDQLQTKLRRGRGTLNEMQERLKDNPQDSIAQDNIQDLKSSIATLNRQLDSVKSNLEKIKQSTIKTNVLAPKQTKYTEFTIPDLDKMK